MEDSEAQIKILQETSTPKWTIICSNKTKHSRSSRNLNFSRICSLNFSKATQIWPPIFHCKELRLVIEEMWLPKPLINSPLKVTIIWMVGKAFLKWCLNNNNRSWINSFLEGCNLISFKNFWNYQHQCNLARHLIPQWLTLLNLYLVKVSWTLPSFSQICSNLLNLSPLCRASNSKLKVINLQYLHFKWVFNKLLIPRTMLSLFSSSSLSIKT